MQVLLIEDNPVDARSVFEALEDAPGVRLTHVSSLAEVAASAEEPPDVALLDLSLLDTEGLATVRRARAVTGDVPIVVLTGDRSETLAFDALREGAEDYLCKGRFSKDSLLRSIRYAIERHSLRTRLSRADRLATVGQLAAGVAHEVSNPASFVLGNSIALEQRLEELRALAERSAEALSMDRDRVAAEMLERLAQAGLLVAENLLGIERIANVTRELQSYSRLSRPETSQVDLNRVVQQACVLVRSSLRQRATLVVELENVPPLVADASKLEQVVTNLLVNATHAIETGTPAENQVRVATRVIDPGGQHAVIELTVSDTGCGIPPERLREIFEPFFTTRPREHGTGLGLSMAREIVHFHGGEIECASVVGQGTRFTVNLPVKNALKPARDKSRTDEARRSADSSPRSRARVLMVDDEPSILRVLHAFLQQDHDVTTRPSAEAALELLTRDSNFDLVISDCTMPGMGGFELHAEVSRLMPHLSNRFLFCTGATPSEQAIDALLEGGNRLLLKPFHPSALMDAVASRLMELGPAPKAASSAKALPFLDTTTARSPRMLELFVAHAQRDWEALERAAFDGSVADVSQSAHRLKGSALTFGAPELAERALRLEQVARAGTAPSADAVAALGETVRATLDALAAQQP